MRKGAATTSRAIAQQSAAADEIARAAEALGRIAGAITRAMAEQAGAAADIAKAADSMRQQSEQTAKALREQARVIKDMTTAAANTAKQIKTITLANNDHSRSAAAALDDLAALHEAVDRSVEGFRQTQTSTEELLRHAEALVGIAASPNGSNGHRTRANGR